MMKNKMLIQSSFSVVNIHKDMMKGKRSFLHISYIEAVYHKSVSNLESLKSEHKSVYILNLLLTFPKLGGTVLQ